MKRFILFVLFVFSVILTPTAFAQDNSFVSIVNPVRGGDFWSQQGQYPQTAILGQIDILRKYNLSATWLIRYDALKDKNIIESLNSVLGDEKGLFLEVTPTWAKDAGVNYREGASWHVAGSAFLTGYERDKREKLIDAAFLKFRQTFGFFPKSVGAWWVDSYSLDYMQKKYGILGNLIVADQYTTDNYQIWGQYWSTPYYPSNKDALNPAQSKEDKLPVVMMQWASRDPVNGYGNGVQESTYSVQANDYIDYHDLDTSYFSKLVDIYTVQPLNSFSHLVVGLENSYSWNRYKNEYANQIRILADKNKSGQFTVATMEKFAVWYQNNFPSFSPPQIIVADDPLGSSKKSVWFMNPYYRVGWFYNQDGSIIRDIRQYVGGEEEICYEESCDKLNFATFATRVLDDVTYHTKWVIDEGKIQNFKVSKEDDKWIVSYVNEVNKEKKIAFLPKDLDINGKISSIDGAILDVIKGSNTQTTVAASGTIGSGKIKFSIFKELTSFLGFIIFIFFIIFIPGYFILEKINEETKTLKDIFLSVVFGLVLFTVSFYLLSIFKLRILIFIYPILGVLSVKGVLKKINVKISLEILPVVLVTVLGTIFQAIPVFKSGLRYDFGIGFWGPNTHDGVWHIALIEQLIKSVPPQNPIFAGTTLKNYHYFYDLLVAATNYISRIDVLDLVFRFYPILFSLLLGIGSYYLCICVVSGGKNKIWAAVISLFLIYFSGSLGWIVEYVTQKHFGGESAFWANQAISFNLNPPFAISLIIMIGIILLISSRKLSWAVSLMIALLSGTLVGFKAYAAVIVIGALFITGIFKFITNRQIGILLVALLSSFLSVAYLLMNGSYGSFFQFSPLWFVNSMIDSPDRVGWARLSLARYSALEKGNWLKLIMVEMIGILLFLIGNLNVRVVGLIKLFRSQLFIAGLALISLITPLLFIQSGTPWNTIQFFYYFMYLCALFSGSVLVLLVKSRYRFIGIPVLLLLLASPINSWATARGYFSSLPHARISNLEFEGLEFLSKQPEGVVLTYPYDKNLKSQVAEPWPISVYDTISYVAAFSKKAVFVEDESQNDILLTDYKKRLIAAKDFFFSPSGNFLLKNNIKYIYIPQHKINLDETKLPVTRIFNNEEVSIYQINK